jgi:hypothetical protein
MCKSDRLKGPIRSKAIGPKGHYAQKELLDDKSNSRALKIPNNMQVCNKQILVRKQLLFAVHFWQARRMFCCPQHIILQQPNVIADFFYLYVRSKIKEIYF